MILLKEVSKAYDKVPILQNINLEIPKGSFCSISGKSGAGKSTLLKIIAGIESPTSGQITLDGTDLKKINYPNLWGNGFRLYFKIIFVR